MSFYDRSTSHIVRLGVKTIPFRFSQKDFACYYCSEKIRVPNNACTANAVVAALLLLQSPTPSIDDDLMYTILARGAQAWILCLVQKRLSDDLIPGISNARLLTELKLSAKRQKTKQLIWEASGVGMKTFDVLPVTEAETESLERYLASRGTTRQRLAMRTVQECLRQRASHPYYPFVRALSKDDVDYVSFEEQGSVSVNFHPSPSFTQYLDVPDIQACDLFAPVMRSDYLVGAEVRDCDDAMLEKRALLAGSILEIMSDQVGAVAAQQLCFHFRAHESLVVRAKMAKYVAKSPRLKTLLDAHTVWLIMLLEPVAVHVHQFKQKYFALCKLVLGSKEKALEYAKTQQTDNAFLQLAAQFFYGYLERLYYTRVDPQKTVLQNAKTLCVGRDPHHDADDVGLPYWRHVPPVYRGLNNDGTVFKTCSPISCLELMRIGRRKGAQFGCVFTMDSPKVSFALVKVASDAFYLVDTHPVFADRIAFPPYMGSMVIHCQTEEQAVEVLREHMRLIAGHTAYRTAVYVVENKSQFL